jgi:glutaredoxin
MEFAAVLLGVSCSRGEEAASDANQAPKPPLVNDERADLVLAYDSPDGPKVASRVDEVPSEARGAVRVQDPTSPPEARDPSWVFIADLSTKAKGGTYTVKAVRRDDYEKQRIALRPKIEAPEPAGAQDPSAAPSAGSQAAAPPGTRVIMYATKHCPVCVKARRWLLDQGIPYVERDVEEDAAAAADLSAKGRAQGVPTSGVPVFEVDGKLVPGFDPRVILKLWSAKVDA